MRCIDVHTHLNLDAFREDRDEVTLRTLERDVWMINVGTGYRTSIRAVEMARKYPKGVFATVGLHPNNVTMSHVDPTEFSEEEYEEVKSGEQFDRELYRELAKHPEVVAIGECGLDYYRGATKEEKKRQMEAFEEQIALANEIKKPLMLHIRNGKDGDAYKDAYACLKKNANVLGNSHFFAGTLEDAKRFWEMGYSTSFTGVITFTHDYDEAVRNAPDDLLHAETDAPYVSPVPYRGKRNEPLFVEEVVVKMAQLRGVSEEELKQQLARNARTMFNLS